MPVDKQISSTKTKHIKILIVEDSQTQAAWLQGTLEENGYQVIFAGNGKQAISVMQKVKPSIIISDILMPEMDGYELCRWVKSNEDLKDTPVILLTLLSDTKDILSGLECGADYFVTKPCDEEYLFNLVQHVLKNWQSHKHEKQQPGVEIVYGGKKYHIASVRQQIIENLVFAYEVAINRNREMLDMQEALRALNEHLEEKVKERMAALTMESSERKRLDDELQHSLAKLQNIFEDTVQALSSTAEKRDPYTAGHQQSVAEFACAIAKRMHLPASQIDGVRVASLVHDIGKVSIPAEILSKPGELAELEFSIIKNHPQHGFDILKSIDFPWPIAQIVLQHHERMDGSGYPAGLRGDDILIEARILAVADVVDAMITHRPYRPAHAIDEAIAEILDNRGVLYDPEVVNACLGILAEKKLKCA